MRRGIENGEPGVFSSAANAADFQNHIISTIGDDTRFHHMYRRGNSPIDYYFKTELTSEACQRNGFVYVGYIQEGTRFAIKGTWYQHFDDLTSTYVKAGAGDGLPLEIIL